MSKVSQHMMIASGVTPLADVQAIAAEVQRLDEMTISVAAALVDQDWVAAARYAYRAAWHYHRLPVKAQREYVTSTEYDDNGPVAVTNDWSASAFVAWLIYRIQTTAQPIAKRLAPKVEQTPGSFEVEQSEQATFLQLDTTINGKL